MTFQEACQAILDDPKANPATYAAPSCPFAGNPARPGALHPVEPQSLAAPEAKEVRATLRLIGGVK
jgi:hypothetical protein